jgi:nickel transport system substrate-binding protein
MKEVHSWYGTPRYLKSWTCNDQGHFVLDLDRPFYPLLQELTYIRPLVFVSASSFAKGVNSDPDLHNSCDAGSLGRYSELEEKVTCTGLSAPIGTGPFKFVARKSLPSDETIDASVTFARNDDYWGIVPDIENVELRYYPDNDAVFDALLSGELDMAMGIGALTAVQVQELKFKHSSKFDVRHSDVTQNSLLLLNTAKAPTDDINVRRAIIHALDKAIFVEKEFAGLEQPASQLMPFSLPYTDVDLTPKLSFDFDKAATINCPASSELSGGLKAGIAFGCVLVVALLTLVIMMIQREKRGKPMFSTEKVNDAENA